MRGLCGWFSERPVDSGRADLGAMLSGDGAAAGDAEQHVAPQAALAVFGRAARPRLARVGSVVFAAAGHPHWRGDTPSDDPLAALAPALRAEGRAAFARLGGDFAVAAWDDESRRGWIAIDRIGMHQLVHGRSNGTLVFASTLDQLRAHPGLHTRLSPQGIHDYLYYHVSPGPQTVFEGLARLQPGHCIEFAPGRVGEPAPYWAMRFDERDTRSFEVLKEEFLALVGSAVSECATGAASGAFLSGGTDSSTVSGMLTRASGAPAKTFSIGFDAQGYDEMEYARIAAKHFGCEHHAYYVTPQDVVAAVPRIAAIYDQPFGNASAIPTYYCAKLAREHGVERLLAGDGGDELFGGNERYGKQHLLGLYGRVPGALRRGLIEPLLLAPQWTQRVPLVRKLRSYVEQARPAMPLRYQSYNLLAHLGHENVFTGDFLASVDIAHPTALMVDEHAHFADASLVNQMLGIDLRFILADGDLPKVSRMCALADVDVAYPLLDDRLVEFSAHLPAALKLRGTQLRWFFKQALADFLPPEIIRKQKHGFGLPVGAWLVGHPPLSALAADGIALLRDRGIVRPQFVDELLGQRLREHPPYYGTMVWVLMMLGLWLDSRKL